MSSCSVIVKYSEGLFIFYEHFIIEDKQNRKIYLTAAERLDNGEDSLGALEKNLEERLHYRTLNQSPVKMEKREFNIRSDFEKEQYLEAINKVINYIVEGDIYIANLTRQIIVESQVKPYEVFIHLHKSNPAPFSCYLNFGNFEIVCSSPERFLKLVDGIAETRPIKGTRKRGETPEEDKLSAEHKAGQGEVRNLPRFSLFSLVNFRCNIGTTIHHRGTETPRIEFKLQNP
jgi:para-aminobenzoate synthetase component 1